MPVPPDKNVVPVQRGRYAVEALALACDRLPVKGRGSNLTLSRALAARD